jgi:hypothetical protein
MREKRGGTANKALLTLCERGTARRAKIGVRPVRHKKSAAENPRRRLNASEKEPQPFFSFFSLFLSYFVFFSALFLCLSFVFILELIL